MTDNATLVEATGATEPGEDAKPLLFISHKHTDRRIAGVVRDFVVESTANKVRVFMSSDPGSEGPAIGQNLNAELQHALDESAAVVLVYTLAENDWTYCMWECGLATNPAGDVAHLYVLQCGEDIPQNFADKVRVRMTEFEDVEKFTRALLTQPGFLAGQGAATDYAPESERVSKWAKRFYEDVAEQLPHNGRARKWPIWPTMSLEMDREVIDAIADADKDKEVDIARDWLATRSVVMAATPGAAGLFNRTLLPDGTEFRELLAEWEMEYPDLDTGWLDVLATQLVLGARQRRSAPIAWCPIREIGGDRRYLPGGGSVRITPGGDRIRMSFHCYARPGARPVTSIMTRLEKTRHIDLGHDAPAEITLPDLLASLDAGNWHRLPVVADGGAAHAIIHMSVMDRFIRERALAGDDVASLTLADLLGDEALAGIFTSTFVVVPQGMDLTNAARAMNAGNGCQDLFVTETGLATEPALGWITDRDLAEVVGAALV